MQREHWVGSADAKSDVLSVTEQDGVVTIVERYGKTICTTQFARPSETAMNAMKTSLSDLCDRIEERVQASTASA